MENNGHLSGLEDYLRSRVMGQDDAIKRVSRALKGSELDLNNRGPRPRGCFLFMGPSGVGKTESTKAFNEYLFGSDRLKILFMNEMKSASDVPELVKAIKREVERHPKGSTFLFDEIEKAHKDITDIFISLMDEGQITDTDGSRINVGNCYLVMTSNIGAQRWGAMEQTKYSVMETFAYEQAKKILRPELFNRLTETIVFRPLSQETQIKIMQKCLEEKLAHLEPKIGKLSMGHNGVTAYLLRKCFTQSGGARKLREELNRQLNDAVIPWAIERKMPKEGKFYCDIKRDCLELR